MPDVETTTPAAADAPPAAVDASVGSGAAMGPSVPTWTRRDELPTISPLPGVTFRVVPGERVMAAWGRLEPGTSFPVHHHPHEQLGVVLEGAVEIAVGDETRRLGTGDTYAIPPDVPHGGIAGPDGCLVLEIFSPPREDYLTQAAAAGSSPDRPGA